MRPDRRDFMLINVIVYTKLVQGRSHTANALLCKQARRRHNNGLNDMSPRPAPTEIKRQSRYWHISLPQLRIPTATLAPIPYPNLS